jgi:2-dehydro-3-deoxyphosphogluconate aldolase/(4S)-4-hydroxy-2-oxoglutarate aldolase
VQDRYGSDVLVGAGTVCSAAQAQDAVAAGAQFLVSPGTRPDLAEALVATKVPTMLGVLSPSELMAAVDAGATAIKLFPASLGGPSLLRALRGPFPDVAIIPTGGVRPDNIADWFDAGALAVGAGSELCAPDAMSQGRWDEIEQRAATFSAALRTVRHRS